MTNAVLYDYDPDPLDAHVPKWTAEQLLDMKNALPGQKKDNGSGKKPSPEKTSPVKIPKTLAQVAPPFSINAKERPTLAKKKFMRGRRFLVRTSPRSTWEGCLREIKDRS